MTPSHASKFLATGWITLKYLLTHILGELRQSETPTFPCGHKVS